MFLDPVALNLQPNPKFVSTTPPPSTTASNTGTQISESVSYD
jgi:hypothetical protein